ncbi:Crinkler (CRN) family protein [Phytophthora palmivora]|uniref:Crinkler (CRN) family protein n=1 Tax=Phytophthora palmivora TaxID=4796 RepID=A0A2P4YAV0_9STRA|nr:Crinkler (CRN) family protein [Phytophthora palmivora]
MVKISLGCAIVGHAGTFDVTIDDGERVSVLKKVIKEKNPATITCDAKDLQLFLTKMEGGTWLTEADVKKGVEDLTGLKLLDVAGVPLNLVDLSEKDVRLQLTKKAVKAKTTPVHVLVVVPEELPKPHEPRDRQLVVGNIPISQSMSLNPPALVAFWKAFLNDRTEVKADALIELPRDTYLLGTSTLGSRIYIRHCYPELWKLCQQMIHDKATNTPHLVILGNPGIGKTFFGFVILLLLARAGATVVYESGLLKQRYLLTNEMVAAGSPNDFVHILQNPATYYTHPIY